MDDIDKIVEEFKNFEDLKQYLKAQHNIIIKLNKENLELKNKIKELEANANIDLNSLNPTEKDSQIICEFEIAKLKKKSLTQELTYEDTKKLEIFTKILSFAQKLKEDNELKNIPEDELINIINYKQ